MRFRIFLCLLVVESLLCLPRVLTHKQNLQLSFTSRPVREYHILPRTSTKRPKAQPHSPPTPRQFIANQRPTPPSIHIPHPAITISPISAAQHRLNRTLHHHSYPRSQNRNRSKKIQPKCPQPRPTTHPTHPSPRSAAN